MLFMALVDKKIFLLFYLQLIRNLLEDLPRMFAENKSVHSALGAALQAATKLLVSRDNIEFSFVCLNIIEGTHTVYVYVI